MSAVGVKRKLNCKTFYQEKKELKWEVEKFRQMITTATNAELYDNGYIFEAGNTLGLISSWKVYLAKAQYHNHLDIFVELQTAPEGVEKINAAFGYKTLTYECKYGTIAFFEHKVKEARSGQGRGKLNAFFPWHYFAENNLENGSLVIHIDFSIQKEVIMNEESKRQKFEHKSLEAASVDFQNLLDSEEDANVTLELSDGRNLKAHGNILKARSRVFSAMLNSPMQEAATGIIRIEDVSYEVMKRILTFIYSGKLAEKWEEDIEELSYASNKYELLLLLSFCDENLASTCTIDNAWTLMDFAKLHGLKTAEREIAEYFKTHVDEILEAKIAKN